MSILQTLPRRALSQRHAHRCCRFYLGEAKSHRCEKPILCHLTCVLDRKTTSTESFEELLGPVDEVGAAPAGSKAPPQQDAPRPNLAAAGMAYPRLGRLTEVTACCRGEALRNAEELPNFAQHLDKAVNFRSRVIEVEAGARGRFDGELAHERLVAVVATA